MLRAAVIRRRRAFARGGSRAQLVAVLAAKLLFAAHIGLFATIAAAENPGTIRPGISAEEMRAASVGCLDCHTKTDAPTMHENPGVSIGCAQCHGGNASIRRDNFASGSEDYEIRKLLAHVRPRYPENFPTSRNPEGSYASILKEPKEFVRFMNPGDLRVADETCGGCHSKITTAVKRSLMTTSAMLWGGAAYNNGILPYKRYLFGESYTDDGEARSILADPLPTPEMQARGALEKLSPLPPWEVVPPGDVFRVFERGGRLIKSQFAEIGLPNPLEEPGKPDIRASNRGPGTGSRVAIPILNIFKTRLNDPHLSLLGTNDHPGDYRSSGCTSCHAIYANDREPAHSGPYAKFGHSGMTITADPTIPKSEKGHPLKHAFTRAIPSSQCMVCHMHQPNMFMNTFLGYTMWDYEADAPSMWPKQERSPSAEEIFKTNSHNPEEAAVRGLWGDKEFLDRVSEINSQFTMTQFADYHGHGWNFRAVFKRDRKGHLLDAKGEQVAERDPHKFKKAVHLSDIHLDKGMHCVDCHFERDAHGDGNIYGEVAQAVEMQCKDCHGTIRNHATLKTTGPAAPEGGTDVSLKRTPFGALQFEWKDGSLIQRSAVTAGLEWRVKQVLDTVTKGNADYNPRAARAKTVERFQGDEKEPKWGNLAEINSSSGSSHKLAHSDDKMLCYTCHTSWTTTCAGCHLPIQANWKSETKHYEEKTTRNFATYNPQVARDEAFQLGVHGPAKEGKIAPVRSSSALVLSSTDINRQKIYVQQPPVSAAGYSSQAFAPHFPHTVRTTETKRCTDCHLSKANDNNAIMAQLLLLGTNFLNFMGYHAYVGLADGGVQAVQVTEWDEPQAVIGSYLHRYAYPSRFEEHTQRGGELQTAHHHSSAGESLRCIQLRGEYLYTAAGSDGFRAYDVANIANKGFSERVVTAPVSPLGQDTHIATENATCFALATTMPVANWKEQRPENMETPLHPIYRYAFITDSKEGLILTDVDTLSDGEPRNNFFKRALTWNENGVLTGARTIQLAGHYALIGTEDKLVVLNVDNPLAPQLSATLPFSKVSGIAVQFRYAFITDANGLHVVNVTDFESPTELDRAFRPLLDARGVYVARTYAYVAGGREGLYIFDVERPEEPKLHRVWNNNGSIDDLNDVKVATTNASLFAYLADGKNGLKVVQLTDPDRVPTLYGFSPAVEPLEIAHYKTEAPAYSISKPIDRDRAVDETGHQVSVFGRLGSRPFNREEMERLFKRADGSVWSVTDTK